MTTLAITLNPTAAALLGTNTRLRLKAMRRGGADHFAIRPSYRVSGFNTMTKVVKQDDGSVIALVESDAIEALKAPVPQAGKTYLIEDVGYGWFLVKETDLTEGALATVQETVVGEPSADAKADTTETAETSVASEQQAEAEAQPE